MQATRSVKIGISFGELEHFHDGLGEFSKQFGHTLSQRAIELAQQGIELYFSIPKRWHGMFGADIQYMDTSPLHRIVHFRYQKFDVWHDIHQHIKFKPPIGTKHHLITLHDLNFFYFKTGGSQRRALSRQLKILRRADHIATISDYVKADLIDKLQWQGPVTRIHNGVRSLTKHAMQAPIDAPTRPFLFHISRMTVSKNVETILRLAALCPDQIFVLAGPRSGNTEGMAKIASDTGLNNVQFMYNVSDDEKTWLYQNCEALLFPSLTEGFGLPPIEAMYFGKPVFLSNKTCLPEIGGDLAFYWEQFDPQYMKDVLYKGLDRHRVQNMAPAIQEWAQRYSWNTCVDQYLRLYKDMLQSKPSHRSPITQI
jgi:glycosyltransferase involved in cell wall biosynthesis